MKPPCSLIERRHLKIAQVDFQRQSAVVVLKISLNLAGVNWPRLLGLYPDIVPHLRARGGRVIDAPMMKFVLTRGHRTPNAVANSERNSRGCRANKAHSARMTYQSKEQIHKLTPLAVIENRKLDGPLEYNFYGHFIRDRVLRYKFPDQFLLLEAHTN
jgi:hypothetical protein